MDAQGRGYHASQSDRPAGKGRRQQVRGCRRTISSRWILKPSPKFGSRWLEPRPPPSCPEGIAGDPVTVSVDMLHSRTLSAPASLRENLPVPLSAPSAAPREPPYLNQGPREEGLAPSTGLCAGRSWFKESPSVGPGRCRRDPPPTYCPPHPAWVQGSRVSPVFSTFEAYCLSGSIHAVSPLPRRISADCADLECHEPKRH